jgi:hypothetical protein
MEGALDRARLAWPPKMPDWVEALAIACDETSQKAVAQRIGRSASLVSSVLSASYKGDLKAVEALVRGALMRLTVDCPVLGEIAGSDCLGHQQRPFRSTNQTWVELYKACRSGCPNARPRAEEKS